MIFNIVWQLLILLSLVCISGFFSASETALLSLSKLRIRHLMEEKVKGADLLGLLLEEPSKLLGTILVGNNVVNIAASALATSIAIRRYGYGGVGIAMGVMTILVLVFAEVTPKSLAAQKPEKVALRVGGILYVLTIVLSPIIILLVNITDLIIRLFGGKINKEKPFITEEEFMTIVKVGHEEGVLEIEEKEMIHNIVEFGDSQVKDIMTPRTDMVALKVSTSYHEALATFKEEGFSRIPVYENTTDNILGILYIKDLIFLKFNEGSFDIRSHLWAPYFTYEFKRTSELFKEMRKSRMRIAIVLDEYGGTAGLITIEDLVEEIVGEIDDEYDEIDEDIIEVKENEYIIKGTTKIDLVNEVLVIDINSEDFDSIGGFVMGEMGRLPRNGEALIYNGIKFVIQDIQRNRIEKLKVTIQGVQ